MKSTAGDMASYPNTASSSSHQTGTVNSLHTARQKGRQRVLLAGAVQSTVAKPTEANSLAAESLQIGQHSPHEAALRLRQRQATGSTLDIPRSKRRKHLTSHTADRTIAKFKLSRASFQASKFASSAYPPAEATRPIVRSYEDYPYDHYYWSTHDHNHPLISKFLTISTLEKIVHSPLPGADTAILKPVPQLYVHFLPNFFTDGVHAVTLQKGLHMYGRRKHFVSPCSGLFSKWDWSEGMTEAEHVYTRGGDKGDKRSHRFIWDEVRRAWEVQTAKQSVGGRAKRNVEDAQEAETER